MHASEACAREIDSRRGEALLREPHPHEGVQRLVRVHVLDEVEDPPLRGPGRLHLGIVEEFPQRRLRDSPRAQGGGEGVRLKVGARPDTPLLMCAADGRLGLWPSHAERRPQVSTASERTHRAPSAGTLARQQTVRRRISTDARQPKPREDAGPARFDNKHARGGREHTRSGPAPDQVIVCYIFQQWPRLYVAITCRALASLTKPRTPPCCKPMGMPEICPPRQETHTATSDDETLYQGGGGGARLVPPEFGCVRMWPTGAERLDRANMCC